MRKKSIISLFTLLAVGLLTPFLPASSFCTVELLVATYEITDSAEGEIAVPLSGVTVVLEVANEGRKIKAVTNSQGVARLKMVPPGFHEVTISEPYYHPEWSQVLALSGATVKGRAHLMPDQFCCPLISGIWWERTDTNRASPALRFDEWWLKHQ